jgi:very-short-patch-repair endonuclease
VFEDEKLIIELDGTQHRKTVKQDSIRDDWFKKMDIE